MPTLSQTLLAPEPRCSRGAMSARRSRDARAPHAPRERIDVGTALPRAKLASPRWWPF